MPTIPCQHERDLRCDHVETIERLSELYADSFDLLETNIPGGIGRRAAARPYPVSAAWRRHPVSWGIGKSESTHCSNSPFGNFSSNSPINRGFS